MTKIECADAGCEWVFYSEDSAIRDRVYATHRKFHHAPEVQHADAPSA